MGEQGENEFEQAAASSRELVRRLGPETKAGVLASEARAGRLSADELARLAELLAADDAERNLVIRDALEIIGSLGLPPERLDELRAALAPEPPPPAEEPDAPADRPDAEVYTERTQALPSAFKMPFEAPRHRDVAENLTVLVAEDEDNLRKLYRLNLEQNGFKVLEAADGLLAWEALERGGIDALVLDLKLPGMHGLDILGRLLAAGSHLPVVVSTAYQKLDDEYAMLAYPRLRYLTKPVDGKHLVETLINLLGEGGG